MITVIIVIQVLGAEDEPASAPSPTPSTSHTAAPHEPSPSPTSSAIALEPGEAVLTTAVEELALFAAPGDASPIQTYGEWSAYGAPTTLMAFGAQTVGDDEWFQVELVGAPNHREAWVRADDVTVESTTTAVHVYLEEREVDLVQEGDITLTSEAVIGAPASPTPVGTFFITDPLDFSSNPSGTYGAYALGLNGYSETLTEFNGGDPQIALHGTDQPDLMGQDVSNGCVRLPNDVITQIADAVAPGTPVIVAESRSGA